MTTKLNKLEYHMLQNVGRVVPLDELWGIGWGSPKKSRTLAVHIMKLRKILGDGYRLSAVHAVGYLLVRKDA